MTFDDFKKGTGVTPTSTPTPPVVGAPVVQPTTKSGISFDDFKKTVTPMTAPVDVRTTLNQNPQTNNNNILENGWNSLKSIASNLPAVNAGKMLVGAGKEIVKTLAVKPFVSLISGLNPNYKGGAVNVPGFGAVEPYSDPALTPTQQLMSTSGDVLNAASLLPLGAAVKASSAEIETQAPKIAEGLKTAGVSDGVIGKLFDFIQSAPHKVGEAIQGGLKSSAYADMTKALGATTKEMRAISDRVVPELVDRGVIAFTRKGLLAKAETAAETAGQSVENTVSTMPQVEHPTSAIIDKLEASKGQFYDTTATGTKIPIEPEKIKNYDELIATVKKYGDKISDNSLIRVRQIWDKTINNAKGFFGKTVAEGSALDARKEATTAIRQELASAHPELAKVNAEFNFWKNVEKVIGSTVEKSANKAPSMSEQTITGVGAAAGLVHGMPLEAAAVAKGAFKLVKSAAWKTVSAAVKNKLADAIVSNNAKVISALVLKYILK